MDFDIELAGFLPGIAGLTLSDNVILVEHFFGM